MGQRRRCWRNLGRSRIVWIELGESRMKKNHGVSRSYTEFHGEERNEEAFYFKLFVYR